MAARLVERARTGGESLSVRDKTISCNTAPSEEHAGTSPCATFLLGGELVIIWVTSDEGVTLHLRDGYAIYSDYGADGVLDAVTAEKVGEDGAARTRYNDYLALAYRAK
jgi:hypothetical protein